MNINTPHTNQDIEKIQPENKTNIFSTIKNSILGFTSFLILGAVTFPIIFALIFLVELTTTGHLESGFSHVLFG